MPAIRRMVKRALKEFTKPKSKYAEELAEARRMVEEKTRFLDKQKAKAKIDLREIEDLKRQVSLLEAQVKRALTDFRGFYLLPPPELRMHVGTKDSAANFWAQGSSSSRRILEVFGEDPGGLVLDWGCGSGRTINWLFGRGTWASNYRGCDVDEAAIEWLRSSGIENVFVSKTIPPLPYPDNHFRGLFCFSVLGHIHPQHHAAWYREFHRILQPGGRAYITLEGDSVIFGRKSFTEEEREQYRRTGWCYSERPGHYKHAGVTSEAFTREAIGNLFVVQGYRSQGYSTVLDDMILQKG